MNRLEIDKKIEYRLFDTSKWIRMYIIDYIKCYEWKIPKDISKLKFNDIAQLE